MEKLAVLLVDPSVVRRKSMSDIVNSTEYGTVIRNASNGQIGLEWLGQFAFDVILFDVSVIQEMGASLIGTIKEAYPTIEIIILSDSNAESAKTTLDAINSGALDFVLRTDSQNPLITMKTKQALEAIFTQIKVGQYLITPKSVNPILNTSNVGARQVEIPNEIDLVLIASSTGGPLALETVIRNLPTDFNKPVLIVQHMPPEFTHVLAESLHKKYQKNIFEGKSGDSIKPNTMMVAPGGYHMVVEEGFGNTVQVKLLDTAFLNGLKPAADILFSSVAQVYQGKNILAVVLTGMGNDATAGIKELKERCHCYCITQSEASCVVYGMPKCVYEAGLSDEVVGLKDIAFRMNQLSSKKG